MLKKKIFWNIILISLFLSCGGKNNGTNTIETITSEKDSVIIVIDGFNLAYTQQKFKLITDSFPQLKGINDIVENPDSTYYKYPISVEGYSFSSEAGQDEFYALYAYFLREKVKNKHENERDNLISIYRSINEIYSEINRGGTYFGHMYARIIGYVEYEIYHYPLESKDYNINDLSKQKEDFIKSLQKTIEKSIVEYKEIGTELDEAKLKQNISQLNNLLTNGFYLIKVRDFKNKYYDF